MNSEEYLKKDITITREERLPISGKSLFSSYCYILLQAFSLFTLHFSLFTNDRV